MTLLTLSNLYAEDFLLHNIEVNLTWLLVGTEMTKSLLRGELSFWRPGGGEKIEGGIKIFTYMQGEPTTLDTMQIECGL